jgi:hypothetical protein
MPETKKHGKIREIKTEFYKKASTYCANKDCQVVICHSKGKNYFLHT